MQERILTLPEVDAAIRNAGGNPYGDPPDAAAYLREIMQGRAISDFLANASAKELEDAHILLAAKVRDGTLKLNPGQQAHDERSLIIGFCGYQIARRLTEVKNRPIGAFEILAEWLPQPAG